MKSITKYEDLDSFKASEIKNSNNKILFNFFNHHKMKTFGKIYFLKGTSHYACEITNNYQNVRTEAPTFQKLLDRIKNVIKNEYKGFGKVIEKQKIEKKVLPIQINLFENEKKEINIIGNKKTTSKFIILISKYFEKKIINYFLKKEKNELSLISKEFKENEVIISFGYSNNLNIEKQIENMKTKFSSIFKSFIFIGKTKGFIKKEAINFETIHFLIKKGNNETIIFSINQ